MAQKAPISAAIAAFKQAHFPGATVRQWQSWKWQLQNRVDSKSKLSQIIALTDTENTAFRHMQQRIPFAVTPYYMGVIARLNQDCTLRKTLVPVEPEFHHLDGESVDPLTEEAHSPVPAIVHRYPDRVLFLATLQCAVYCRYCTRARIFSQPATPVSHTKHWQEGLDYIRGNSGIREVIVSGGDPLLLDDGLLGDLLQQLRCISHVQIIRLGTKIPLVLPQRITSELVNILKAFHPLIMSLHVIHPDELTPEVAEAITRLADAGIVIGSQTVLLKGVNDSPSLIQKLMERLLSLRVRPYALFQCDPILGSGHFRTELEKGIEIIETLRRQTGGYAVPHFIVDPPGGKVNLAPRTLVSKSDTRFQLRNWRGDEIEYRDPLPEKR